MWSWRDENNNINVPACKKLLEAYVRSPPATGDMRDPRFWLSMAFGELLREFEELRTGVKAPVVDRNSTTVPDGKRRQIPELDLLRRVAAGARAYLNASSDEVCRYRLGSLEDAVREWEQSYSSPGSYSLTSIEPTEPISVERPMQRQGAPVEENG